MTCGWGQAVLIARDNARRGRLNAIARAELKRQGRLGESIDVAGEEFAVGDRVVARRNDRLRAIDNGMRGTVIAVDPTEKEVALRTDAGAQRVLEAAYVSEHLQHAYALTAHTIQGGTVEWAGIVGHPEDFTRNWSYTALSRAREATEIFLIDTPTEHQLTRADVAPDQPAELSDPRTPSERLDAAMRQRDDEDLAIDRLDTNAPRSIADHDAAGNNQARVGGSVRQSVDELRAELAQLRNQLRRHPNHVADELQAARSARAEAQRAVDNTRSRISDLERQNGGLLRRRPSGLDAELALERARFRLAEHQLATATERERALTTQVPDPTAWNTERRALRERLTELEADMGLHHREHLRRALDDAASYLTTALGARPSDPRARHTWESAAQLIEEYRFQHTIASTDDALGPRPTAAPARAQWQRAQHELDRAQRELGRRNRRGLQHEL